MSASSSSPEPTIEPVSAKSKGKKSKGKEKEKSSKNVQQKPYKPPAGFIPLQNIESSEDFEWDTINDNDGQELWLIRIPEGVKPKALDGFSFDLNVSPSETAKVGELTRKTTSFDLWSVGDASSPEDMAAGEELKGLSCLLPKEGKLYRGEFLQVFNLLTNGRIL